MIGKKGVFIGELLGAILTVSVLWSTFITPFSLFWCKRFRSYRISFFLFENLNCPDFTWSPPGKFSFVLKAQSGIEFVDFFLVFKVTINISLICNYVGFVEILYPLIFCDQ